MTHQHKGAGLSLLARLLHHVTRRRNRVYGVIGFALVLLAIATWIYGGFATGIDFTTAVPRLPGQFSPAKGGANGETSSASRATGAIDATGATSTGGARDYQTPTQTAPSGQATGSTGDTSDHGWRHSTHNPAANISHSIPSKIWQILLPKNPSASASAFVPSSLALQDTPSWLVMNPDYTYTLVGQKGGDAFVRRHYGSNRRIVEAYEKMPNVGMKSDLLRYLILGAVGGVYTDTDTVALQAIDRWVPAGLRDKVAVVVGLEFDRRDGNGWADILHWVQFCQWTIAAAPGHPVFLKMAARVLQSLDDLSAHYGVPFADLRLTSAEVMNSTGPAAWTDVVFRQLQEYDPSLVEPKNLSYMTEPRLYGNILILPIDGFGMGQPHSNSTDDGTIPEAALVRHRFSGGWRD